MLVCQLEIPWRSVELPSPAPRKVCARSRSGASPTGIAARNLRSRRHSLSERKRDRDADRVPVSSLRECEAAARELFRRGAGTVILTSVNGVAWA